jgi:hypothetical protein
MMSLRLSLGFDAFLADFFATGAFFLPFFPHIGAASTFGTNLLKTL